MRIRKNFLNRSNLRDIIIFIAAVSSLYFNIAVMDMVFGFVFLALGSFFHFLAKGILIRNVILCDEGVYGMVRHPYYLSNYLIDTSFCVLSGNPYMLLIYPFLFFWSYGPTLRNEEKVLATRHGKSFAESAFSVPQVFPDIGSWPGIKRIFKGFSKKRITWKEMARIARFCSICFIILLIHDLEPHGFAGLKQFLNPLTLTSNELLYIVFAALLYMASIILIRISMTKCSQSQV